MMTETSFLQHGVMMNIFDTGVLLTGKSGTGKSELALSLLHRGHQLIADDVVEVFRHDNTVIGRASQRLQDLLEIRGIAIFNIKELFGAQAVMQEQVLAFIIHLEKTDFIHRHIAFNPLYQSICDISIPRVILPFSEQRRGDILVETLVRHFQHRNHAFRCVLT